METEQTFDTRPNAENGGSFDPFDPATWQTPEVSPEPIPAGFAQWDPGLFMHAVLTSIDRSQVSGHDLVAVLVAEERLISHLQALQAKTMAELARADSADPHGRSRAEEANWDTAAAEIGAALHLTRRGADARLAMAFQLVERHPRVLGALDRGELDLYRARVICEGVAHLDTEVAVSIVDTVLERASRLTAGQLRAWIRRLVVTEDPEGASRRYEQAIADRRVVALSQTDGTADLCGFDLPADRVAEARAFIEALARHAAVPGDNRTIDQRRADVFLDLLSGIPITGNARARGTVDIRIDLTTLAELAHDPGEIPGWGPVLADIARHLAIEDGRQWQITLTDGERAVWCGTTRRRPDTGLTRRLRARYPRCVFPGCRMPARRCDLDHTQPWSKGGPTCEHNLAPLCRHHHILKHRGWTLQRLDDGTHLWTSPLGWHYTPQHPP